RHQDEEPAPEIPVGGKQAKAHATVPDENQVEEGQHLHDAALGKAEEIEDPELADLVGDDNSRGDYEAAGEKPPVSQHSLCSPRPAQPTVATTSAQRWQRSGLSRVPTSGRVCQQRAHFSPSATAVTTPIPAASSSRKASDGAAPTTISAAEVMKVSARSTPSKASR